MVNINMLVKRMLKILYKMMLENYWDWKVLFVKRKSCRLYNNINSCEFKEIENHLMKYSKNISGV